MTEVNLKTANISVTKNQIMILMDNRHKVYYSVLVEQTPFSLPNYTPKSAQEINLKNFTLGPHQIKLLKTYGDFRHLSEFLALSDLELSGKNLPEFPAKRALSGVKKSGAEL